MAEISAQDAAFPALSRMNPWDFGTRSFCDCDNCKESYRVTDVTRTAICPKCFSAMAIYSLEAGQMPKHPPAKLAHPPMPHEAPVKPTMSTEELRRQIREEQNRKASKLHDLRRAKVHPRMLDQIIPKD